MSCPHTTTTAILSVFGEAPLDFEDHLSTCESCRAVVAEHLQTVGVITPMIKNLDPPAVMKWRWPLAVSSLAFAAVVLFALQRPPIPVEPEVGSTVVEHLVFIDPIDEALLALELELALLELEN